jgi:microcystin-dependent protein
MTYQGRLTDASNAPVPDGTGYEIEVRLWSASTGGTLLWGTRYTGVPLKSGAFNLILGSGGTPIPGATHTDLKLAFNNAKVYLGIKMTKNAGGIAVSSSELIPRQEIFSTPYAFRADVVSANGVDSAAIKNQAVDLDELSTRVAEKLTPVGMVSSFVGTNAPTGWLLCDGATVSRSQYAALFAIMGISHGSGDGATTFHLPDYRGRFLRGVDGPDGSNGDRDPDSASRSAMANGGTTANGLGSVQADQLIRHSHELFLKEYVWTDDAAMASSNSPSGRVLMANRAVASSTANDGLGTIVLGQSITGTGGLETRPKNAAVNFIIKH